MNIPISRGGGKRKQIALVPWRLGKEVTSAKLTVPTQYEKSRPTIAATNNKGSAASTSSAAEESAPLLNAS